MENKISYDVRGAAFKVYNDLGPGLFESVYEAALAFELIENGYQVKTQVALPMYYRQVKFEIGFRIDILINEKVIVEVKSIDSIADVHYKQLLTYLRLANKKLGLPLSPEKASLSLWLNCLC